MRQGSSNTWVSLPYVEVAFKMAAGENYMSQMYSETKEHGELGEAITSLGIIKKIFMEVQ